MYIVLFLFNLLFNVDSDFIISVFSLFGSYSINSLSILTTCFFPFLDGINFSRSSVNIPNPILSLFLNAKNIKDAATSKLKSNFDFTSPKLLLADKSNMV